MKIPVLLNLPSGVDFKHLKSFQQDFIIAYMDKCCNNFVFVCKSQDVSTLFDELNSPLGTYHKLWISLVQVLRSHCLLFFGAKDSSPGLPLDVS